MTKTNAMRIIEKAGVEYNVYTYDGGALSGVEVAAALGEDVDRVYKTLVTTAGPGKFYVFVIPVAAELDLKKAAKAAGEKAVEMLPQKQLLPATGYIHGGCSPVGMKKLFPTFFDSSADGKTIFVSAGKVGMQVELPCSALLQITGGKLAELVRG
ncbi:MAG TPA: Cys-tRNA(Pro) deacylase [Candidatus Coproplasma excrementigallinarum]|uniref:Cys-tRNA(Pro)/Cys-tRNA(Cys) deacylase n=1 Tax=Candidatus Coproplasma excrementigallinarum TaxID=2840747 RepID=A0A9D1MJ70_9FIRM|nr:Cys-tRNA(Pro) deacylase [Candidatus Coproplasma excrementigallinarum]